METKEIIVYEVNELSESSRERARQYWIDHYSHGTDMKEIMLEHLELSMKYLIRKNVDQ